MFVSCTPSLPQCANGSIASWVITSRLLQTIRVLRTLCLKYFRHRSNNNIFRSFWGATIKFNTDPVSATPLQTLYLGYPPHQANASHSPCPIFLSWINFVNFCSPTMLINNYYNKFRMLRWHIQNFQFKGASFSTTASCGFPSAMISSPLFLQNSTPPFWADIGALRKHLDEYKIIFVGQTCERMCVPSYPSTLLASKSSTKPEIRLASFNLFPFQPLSGKTSLQISSQDYQCRMTSLLFLQLLTNSKKVLTLELCRQNTQLTGSPCYFSTPFANCVVFPVASCSIVAQFSSVNSGGSYSVSVAPNCE